MPGKDKTGPKGEGPMTGRGFGNCNPEATNQREFGKCCGRRRGRGQGRGLGFRNSEIDRKELCQEEDVKEE